MRGGTGRAAAPVTLAVTVLASALTGGCVFKDDDPQLRNVRGKLTGQRPGNGTPGAYLMTTRDGTRYALTDANGLLAAHVGNRVMVVHAADAETVRAARGSGELPVLDPDEVRPLRPGDERPLPAPSFGDSRSKAVYFGVRVPRCLQGDTALYGLFAPAGTGREGRQEGGRVTAAALMPDVGAVRLRGGQSDETPYPGFVYRKLAAFEPGTKLRVWIARGTPDRGPDEIVYPRGSKASTGKLVTVNQPPATTVAPTYNPNNVRPREQPLSTRECRRS